MQDPHESCCVIDYERLKSKRAESNKPYLENPEKPVISEREVLVRHKENYVKEVAVRGFTFISDEPEEIGGTNRGPRPMEYFLGGAALCEMAMIVGCAIDMDIKLDHIEVLAKAQRDNRRLYGVETAPAPGFRQVTYEVKIDCDAEEQKVRELISRAEHRCPGYNSLVNPIKVRTDIILKGKPI